MVENSDVLKEVLSNLINISARKTNTTHAVLLMDSLIKNLGSKYSFLRDIKIKDTTFLEDANPVSIMSQVDDVSPSQVGMAIHDIISTMNTSLGKDAGYFFIKEFSRSIDDEYHSTMMDMGVDLGLMQLEREVNSMQKNLKSSK